MPTMRYARILHEYYAATAVGLRERYKRVSEGWVAVVAAGWRQESGDDEDGGR